MVAFRFLFSSPLPVVIGGKKEPKKIICTVLVFDMAVIKHTIH